MTLRGVDWRAGGRSILQGVDLTIFRGERLLLLGDNGCGKTSLLRLMARLARPTAGEIRQFIDPALGQRRGSRAWFRRVGVVYQNPNCQLFMPTVAQEVASLPKARALRGRSWSCSALRTYRRDILTPFPRDRSAGCPLQPWQRLSRSCCCWTSPPWGRTERGFGRCSKR